MAEVNSVARDGEKESEVLSIDEFLSNPLVTATRDERVTVVARRMTEAGVGAVVVLDGEELVGLFSERDLLVRVVAEGRDLGTTTVGDVATADVITADPGESLEECAAKLRSNGIRHLPVVKEGRPVGVVSARDFFESVAGQFEALLGRLRYKEQLADNTDPYDHIGGSYGR